MSARPADNPISRLGDVAVGYVAAAGAFWLFCLQALLYAPASMGTLRGWRRLIPQCYAIGTLSVPVVMLTGSFVGMVLVVQGWPQFEASGLADRLGGIVNVSVAAELGPVLAGVMLAGRVGGALTAQLGTMNVTEQLLALRSMGADPVHHLVTPRFLACLLLSPLLTCYANITGALGGWLIFSFYYPGDSRAFWFYTAEIVEYWDLGTGLIKAVFFGGAIGMISCYKGFTCRPGAEGVGRACTEAFVSSFIVILVLDLLLNMTIARVYDLWYGPRVLLV